MQTLVAVGYIVWAYVGDPHTFWRRWGPTGP